MFAGKLGPKTISHLNPVGTTVGPFFGIPKVAHEYAVKFVRNDYQNCLES